MVVFVIGLAIKNFSLMVSTGIPAVGLLLLILIISCSVPEEPTGRYEYQVTIDDNVSFTDICENYEIVEQNGKIWTIRDKEAE